MRSNDIISKNSHKIHENDQIISYKRELVIVLTNTSTNSPIIQGNHVLVVGTSIQLISK
jgi:hypothetical protein